MIYKEISTLIAIAITFMAFYPYIQSILQGRTKPHVFSWVIWGSTTFVVFLAQISDGGGVGAWPIGISGIVTILIAVLAYIKRSDVTITRLDWMFFVSALSSLPLWYLSSNPLWAIVILTAVDVLGFGPTFRKVYAQPYSESLVFFALFALRNSLVILALENYSVTTVLFPAIIAFSCMLLIFLAIYRRRVLFANY